MPNLIDRTFGRIRVMWLSHYDKADRVFYQVKCDCGRTLILSETSLTEGNVRDCGCMKVKTNESNL